MASDTKVVDHCMHIVAPTTSQNGVLQGGHLSPTHVTDKNNMPSEYHLARCYETNCTIL